MCKSFQVFFIRLRVMRHVEVTFIKENMVSLSTKLIYLYTLESAYLNMSCFVH